MVGGQAPKAIRSVECYDFEEERWDQVAELPSRRCRAGKGHFAANFFISLMQLLSTGWMSLVLPLVPLCPWPQAALFAIPSSSFSTDIFPFLFRWMSCSLLGLLLPVSPPQPLSPLHPLSLLAIPPSVFPLLPPHCCLGSPQGPSFSCWFPSENQRS